MGTIRTELERAGYQASNRREIAENCAHCSAPIPEPRRSRFARYCRPGCRYQARLAKGLER